VAVANEDTDNRQFINIRGLELAACLYMQVRHIVKSERGSSSRQADLALSGEINVMELLKKRVVSDRYSPRVR
jgi:hypothetical protein